MQAPLYQAIELAELDHRAATMLIDELIGQHGELQTIRLRIAERSSGNPFFIEELVRSLVDSGILAGPRGAYRRGDRRAHRSSAAGGPRPAAAWCHHRKGDPDQNFAKRGWARTGGLAARVLNMSKNEPE
jgi:hypothetical protein